MSSSQSLSVKSQMEPLTHSASLETTLQTLDLLTEQFTLPQSDQSEQGAQSHLKQLKRSLKEILLLIDEKFVQQQKELKSLITDLTKIEKSIENTNIDEIKIEQENLQNEKENIQQKVNQLQLSVKTLNQNNLQIEKERSNLLNEKKRLAFERSQSLPIAIKTLALYKHFSSISWDYSECSEKHIQGKYVFDQNIVPFEFAVDDSKKIDIVDKLWSIMWENTIGEHS